MSPFCGGTSVGDRSLRTAKGRTPLRLAVLSAREDEEAVLSTDEPGRADASQEPQARRAAA